MADWLYEPATAAPEGLAAYAVLDAVGMRLGVVDGWVRAPNGTVALLSLATRAALRGGRHLVPLGYVTQVDFRRRHLRLRELTRKALARRLPGHDDGLPSPEELEAALREAPDVRPGIALVLGDPARGVRPFFPARAGGPPETGDGRGGLAPAPPTAARPLWQPLVRLTGPAWETSNGEFGMRNAE